MFLFSLAETADADDVAAPFLDKDAVLLELALDLVGIGVGLVDLVDGYDHRDSGGPGVVDRLPGLGHDRLVRGDDQDDDVGRLGPAGAELSKRLVARSVDEGDRPLVVHDAVGADVLGDPARLLVDEVGGADGVEERRLAVVDVTHDRHDRRPGDEVGLLALGAEAHLALDGHDLDRPVEVAGELGGEGVIDDVRGAEDVSARGQLFEEVPGPDLQPVGQVLHRRAFAEGDEGPGLGRFLGLGRGGRSGRPGGLGGSLRDGGPGPGGSRGSGSRRTRVRGGPGRGRGSGPRGRRGGSRPRRRMGNGVRRAVGRRGLRSSRSGRPGGLGGSLRDGGPGPGGSRVRGGPGRGRGSGLRCRRGGRRPRCRMRSGVRRAVGRRGLRSGRGGGLGRGRSRMLVGPAGGGRARTFRFTHGFSL